MNFINEYGLALGWTLIHMAWITLGIAIVVQLLRLITGNPRFNYVIGMLSMLALPFIAVGVFGSQVDLSYSADSMTAGFAKLINDVPQHFINGGGDEAITVSAWIEQHMDWVLVLWFAGMISFIVRLLFGYTALVGFRQSIQPMSDYWTDRFQSIFKEFNIKTNVLFGSSKRVDGPVTFGFVKPMILLPIGLVNALCVDEVEAIIRHELAHIARHDYVFKMIQSAIESLFYYTPGTWWLTKMVDIDREQCCDDYAIRSGSSAAAYVNALYKVNTFNALESQLALGFGKEKNQLLNRVKRILKQPQEKANIMGRLIIPIILLLVVAGVSINATLKDDVKNVEPIAAPEVTREIDPFIPQVQVPPTVALADTTRPKSKSKSVTESRVNGNGKSYSVTRENGKITEMKVDGKKVDPKDYHKHEDQMKKSFRSDGIHFDYDTDMTDEQKRELEQRMEELGERMEGFGEEFGENLGIRIEELGDRLENWGERLEKDGDWTEYEKNMAEWGEKFGKSFGEDFGKGMAEWGEKFGNSFAFDFDTEGIEKWGEEIEKKVEEYRMKHPEKFYQGGDGEWHLKEDNLTDEEAEEIFGEGWTEDLSDNIIKMMDGLKFDFDMGDFDINIPPVPPVPPFPGMRPYEGAQPFKLEMRALKSQLKTDGFFKDKDQVAFEMNEKSLIINGKTQSNKVFKKYEQIIKDNWGEDYLEEYDIDFNIIDKESGKKKAKGTYRI